MLLANGWLSLSREAYITSIVVSLVPSPNVLDAWAMQLLQLCHVLLLLTW